MIAAPAPGRHFHVDADELLLDEPVRCDFLPTLTLDGIGETVLIYPSTGGRPKARRMLTETTDLQDQLATIYRLDRWAPKVRS